MVNYKRVVCEVAVLALLAAICAAAPAPDCHDTHYNQSQNGTENYRINIDGVVIAVAPAEAFVAAVSDIDISGILEELNEAQKPKPPADSSPSKPEEPKPDPAKPQETKPESPEKPEAAALSDISMDTVRPETKSQKKDNRKQVKGQRLKTLLANMLVPLLRKAHTHEN